MKRWMMRKRGRSGCGLLLLTCAVACALIALNRALVTSFYGAIVPPSLDFPRFGVFIQFLAMIALLLPEWWLIDWTLHRIRRLYKAAETLRERR